MPGFGEIVASVARWLNPVAGSPSSPLETTVFLDSFGPSLMPRTSVHQGLASGLSVLAARGVTKVAEIPFNAVVPADAGLAAHLTGRAVMGAAGVALSELPVEGRRDDVDDHRPHQRPHRAGRRPGWSDLRPRYLGAKALWLGLAAAASRLHRLDARRRALLGAAAAHGQAGGSREVAYPSRNHHPHGGRDGHRRQQRGQGRGLGLQGEPQTPGSTTWGPDGRRTSWEG